MDGICTAWYGNGNKSSVQTFMNGKILNATGWKPNGELCPSTKVLNGVGVVVVYGENKAENAQSLSKIEYTIERYDNGNKREEGSYLNGKKRVCGSITEPMEPNSSGPLTKPAGRTARR